jgi:hypothetical protein
MSSSSATGSCLILDGMGPLGPDELYTKPIYEELTLRHGLQASVVHLDTLFITPEQIATALDRGNFSACIILGWGSGSNSIALKFSQSNAFRIALVSFVQEGGGLLMVHGERISHVGGDWPEWFGLTWKSSDYYRTDHMLNTDHWFKEHATCSNMNVKATMVTSTKAEDILYGTREGAVTYSLVPMMAGKPVDAGQATFTLAKSGHGTVSFFGDVNQETPTIETIGVIVKHRARLGTNQKL